jgi:hypothetical protein
MKKFMADDTKDALCLTELDHVTTKKLSPALIYSDESASLKQFLNVEKLYRALNTASMT